MKLKNHKIKIPNNSKMRQSILIILVCLFFSSCGNSAPENFQIKSGFIFEPGIYHIFQPKFKSKNIILKEFKDGSKIFAITDSMNKILFQQSINQTFSKYHYWCLFVDENANVWFYNSDYSSAKAIILNEKTKLYEMKDFCAEKLNLPVEFRKELELKNTFNNCKSLNK